VEKKDLFQRREHRYCLRKAIALLSTEAEEKWDMVVGKEVVVKMRVVVDGVRRGLLYPHKEEDNTHGFVGEILDGIDNVDG
jgi:hypothetical protein